MARVRRIKLVWGSTAKYPEYRSLGLWLVDARATDAQIKGVVVNVRTLLWWLAVILAAGYVGATQEWYTLQRRHPHCTITRVDALLLPVRWPQVREQTGRALVAEALDDFQAQRWGAAQLKLQAGLARAPRERPGRMALASLWAASGRAQPALDLLGEEIAFGYPGRDYLAQLFKLAGESEDYARLIRICDQLRERVPAGDRTWLITQELRGLVATERYEEAIRIVDAEGDQATGDIREAKALALIKLGRFDPALAYVQAWAAWPGANRVQVLRLWAQALGAAHRPDALEQALAQLHELAPSAPQIETFAIVQEVLAGRSKEAGERLEDYLWRFGAVPDNISLAATQLQEAGATRLVQRCVDEALAHGFSARDFLVFQLEAQVSAGAWLAAGQTLGRLAPFSANADAGGRFYQLWMQRLVAAANPDRGLQVALLELLRDRPLSLRIYQRTAQTMLAAGRLETAQQACAFGQQAFPTSSSLRDLHEQIEARIAAAPKTPAPIALAVTAPAVPEEAVFFKQLDELAGAGRWDDAGALVQKVRAFRPDWAVRREAAVLDWAMRIAIKTDDAPELIGAARLFLTGSTQRADRMLKLAEEVRRGGDKPHADTLVAEVLRRMPDYAPARELRDRWQPKPPPHT